VDRQGQHIIQRKGSIGLGDFENKPSEMSNKTGFRIPILSMVHVTSVSSAVYLATLPFYGLASMVQEYGSTESIMTGYSSKYYEKNESYGPFSLPQIPHEQPRMTCGEKGGRG
jgi:hypothetical protein